MHSKDIRERFVKLLDEGASASSVARHLVCSPINRSTLGHIWRAGRQCEPLPIERNSRSAAIEAHAPASLSWVAETPDIYLPDICLYETVAKLKENGLVSSIGAVRNLLIWGDAKKKTLIAQLYFSTKMTFCSECDN